MTDLEIALLLEAVYRKRGYDFRAYDAAYLRDRIGHVLAETKVATVSALQERVLHNLAGMERFLQSFMVEPVSVFVQPEFFASFILRVKQILGSTEMARIWIAECDGTADGFSAAILLRESNLSGSVRLYVTSMNESSVESAEQGILPAASVKGRAPYYRRAGGRGRLTDYYRLKSDTAQMKRSLCEPLVWANHNLVTDASFNQFHCVICRHALGRFGPALRRRVGELIYESLTIGGLLGVGSAADMEQTPHRDFYEVMDESGQWYRKVG